MKEWSQRGPRVSLESWAENELIIGIGLKKELILIGALGGALDKTTGWGGGESRFICGERRETGGDDGSCPRSKLLAEMML